MSLPPARLPTGVTARGGGYAIPRVRRVVLPRQAIPQLGRATVAARVRPAGAPLLTTPLGDVALAPISRARLFDIGFVGMGLILLVFGLAGLVQSGAKAVLTSDAVSTLGPTVAGAINPAAGVAASALTLGAKSKSPARSVARALSKATPGFRKARAAKLRASGYRVSRGGK